MDTIWFVGVRRLSRTHVNSCSRQLLFAQTLPLKYFPSFFKWFRSWAKPYVYLLVLWLSKHFVLIHPNCLRWFIAFGSIFAIDGYTTDTMTQRTIRYQSHHYSAYTAFPRTISMSSNGLECVLWLIVDSVAVEIGYCRWILNVVLEICLFPLSTKSLSLVEWSIRHFFLSAH